MEYSVRARQDQHSGNRTFFSFLSLAWIWIRNWIRDFDSCTSERLGGRYPRGRILPDPADITSHIQ